MIAFQTATREKMPLYLHILQNLPGFDRPSHDPLRIERCSIQTQYGRLEPSSYDRVAILAHVMQHPTGILHDKGVSDVSDGYDLGVLGGQSALLAGVLHN